MAATKVVLEIRRRRSRRSRSRRRRRRRRTFLRRVHSE